MKRIVILGSTGSVGRNAIRVVEEHKGLFRIVGLAAGSNVNLLSRQIESFKVPVAAIGETAKCAELKRLLKRPCKVLAGISGLNELASMENADTILIAMSGISALLPTISAVRAGKKIALANKECIVSAGCIIMNLAKRYASRIVPVDSEHSAIFQCLEGRDINSIKNIILLGSGGPLKDVKESLFDRLRPPHILSHPVWKMGKKITVDSATMMNKGLEVIEASVFFNINVSKIKVLIHPEAIIHSMVELIDGNIVANLFYPDMRIPIFYAFTYPERKRSTLPELNFREFNKITFQEPDTKKFPALSLCYDVAKRGGTYPVCLNSANEEAVKLYINGRIRFTDIVAFVKKAVSRHKNTRRPSIDQILEVDRITREYIRKIGEKKSKKNIL